MQTGHAAANLRTLGQGGQWGKRKCWRVGYVGTPGTTTGPPPKPFMLGVGNPGISLIGSWYKTSFCVHRMHKVSVRILWTLLCSFVGYPGIRNKEGVTCLCTRKKNNLKHEKKISPNFAIWPISGVSPFSGHAEENSHSGQLFRKGSENCWLPGLVLFSICTR